MGVCVNFFLIVCDSPHEEKWTGKEDDRTENTFPAYKQTQTSRSYVSNATIHWRWQEKVMLRESAAATCLQGAAGDEMPLLMKWDCSLLSIYCS